MALLKELTYKLGATVKIEEYQYVKPEISVTLEVEEGDDSDKIFKQLTDTVREELDKEVKRLKKQYRS